MSWSLSNTENESAFLCPQCCLPQDSKLSLVDAELALQMKIFEAARKLYEEQHPSKAVRKSRLLQCKREEKKLKRLQETAFQLQLERGRSSPLPALNVAQGKTSRHETNSQSSSVFGQHSCDDKLCCLNFRSWHFRWQLSLRLSCARWG